MATWYQIYPNVTIGPESTIGEFVSIGDPPTGAVAGELETLIGHQATIRSHTVIYAGNRIGNQFQTGHGVLIRELNQIGDRVSVGTHSVSEHHVILKDGVRIHSSAVIPEYSIVEEEVWIGPHVVFTNVKYPHSLHAKANMKGPIVRPHAKIGANATLLPGVHIGVGALIGAGAVVVEDVSDDTIVVGNPARPIGSVSRLDAYTTMRFLQTPE